MPPRLTSGPAPAPRRAGAAPGPGRGRRPAARRSGSSGRRRSRGTGAAARRAGGALERLAPEGAQPVQLAQLGDHPLHRGRAERADQLVLQAGVADEEPEPLGPGPGGRGADAGPLQLPADVALLAGVAEARDDDPVQVEVEVGQEVPDVGHPAHGEHPDALRGQVAAPARGQRQHRGPVALPLHQHHPVVRGNRRWNTAFHARPRCRRAAWSACSGGGRTPTVARARPVCSTPPPCQAGRESCASTGSAPAPGPTGVSR